MIRLSLALFVSLLAAGPPTTDPMPRTIAERTAQALATASSPTGTAALLRLDELREYVNDANQLERTLAQVARSPKTDAFTRTSARLLLLQDAHDEARVDAARAQAKGLGFIQAVYVVVFLAAAWANFATRDITT